MSELPPTPRQRLRKALLDCGKRADAAEARVKVLEEVLAALVADVQDYERVNNLAPSPGRLHSWLSMRRAIATLASKEEGGR